MLKWEKGGGGKKGGGVRRRTLLDGWWEKMLALAEKKATMAQPDSYTGWEREKERVSAKKKKKKNRPPYNIINRRKVNRQVYMCASAPFFWQTKRKNHHTHSLSHAEFKTATSLISYLLQHTQRPEKKKTDMRYVENTSNAWYYLVVFFLFSFSVSTGKSSVTSAKDRKTNE